MKRLHWLTIAVLAMSSGGLVGCSSGGASPGAAAAERPARVETATSRTTATVKAVDAANRTVTLARANGETETYQCGPAVINFDRIRVGDQVNATVTEQLAIFVRPAGAPGSGSASMVALAPRGEMPGVVMAKTSEIRASIVALDPNERTVRLKNANGDVRTFPIRSNIDLKNVHVGDDVVMEYTQGLALLVERTGDQAAQEAAGAELTKTAQAFVSAYEKGDAKAVAAFWAPDGEYTNSNGRTLRGRKAIEDDFAATFAENKGMKLRVEVGSRRFPTADTAIEDGVTSVMLADGSAPNRERYSNLFVKRDGAWQLQSVRESEYVPPNNVEHLHDLDWAIGEWKHETKEGQVGFVRFDWSDDLNYIDSVRAVGVKELLLDNGSQRIGWDPRAQQIRSWNFESDGGFGESTWSRDGNDWVINSSTVLRSGARMTATTRVKRIDADTVSWQSTNQQVDGQQLEDSPVIKMKRVKASDVATGN